MRTENPYRPSPCCPHCAVSMRFVRSFPNYGAQPPLETFECLMCGLSVTQMSKEAMEVASAAA